MEHKLIKNIIGLLLILLLAACAGTDTAVEEQPLDDIEFDKIVSASGKVMPVRWAELGFESGGRLTTIVKEGSEARNGSELARVEAVDLEQAVLQAEANLAVSEAQLAQALAGSRAEDIAAAVAGVDIAAGRVAAAKGGLEQTKNDNSSAIKTAEAQLARAKAEANRAYAELALLQDGPRPEEIAALQARVNQLQSEFLIAENIHFDGFIDKDIGGGPEERARYARESARNARDAAQAELDLANAGANGRSIAAASSGLGAAQAQVSVAEVALEQAQASAAEVAVAQAQVLIAEGEMAQAEAQYEKLLNGRDVAEIAVLEAEVARAEAALSQAKAALSRSKIVAPFAGTIGNVLYRSGEVVSAEVPVLVLGDTSRLRVETTDLNEVDAAQVGIGSSVTLTFDALPGTTFEGEIVRIAPMASAGQGGTNFTATIEMADPPQALRWGMTAFVDIDVE